MEMLVTTNPAAARRRIAQQLRPENRANALMAALGGIEPPADWQERLLAVFPSYFPYPFSPPHFELWQWVALIEAISTPRPFVALWSRGRGKSTNAEAAAVDLGARGKRFYCWYVSETQDQADKHVVSIRLMMESETGLRYYPSIGRPRITRTGGQAWRRNLLMAANGYSIEAIGLDKAIRGGKIESQRPDLIIFDDVDDKHDTAAATLKKEGTITTSILPAGSANCATLFVQNLIFSGSIAHRLSKKPGGEGAADYLANRFISGPYPAVEGLQYEYQVQEDSSIRWVITAGRSLWNGFTLEVCEAEINREGPTAFELESQHEIDTDNPLALLTSETFRLTRVSSHPDLYRIVVGIDPSGGAGECGIVGAGVAKVGRVDHGYTLADFSTPPRTSSAEWAVAALRCYHALSADAFVVEKNFGGDMAGNTIRTAELRDGAGNLLLSGKNVKIIEVTASRGKEVRAEPVAALFELGRGHHVGNFPEMEKQWAKWQPGSKPSPGRLDAETWCYTELLVDDGKQKTARVLGGKKRT